MTQRDGSRVSLVTFSELVRGDPLAAFCQWGSTVQKRQAATPLRGLCGSERAAQYIRGVVLRPPRCIYLSKAKARRSRVQKGGPEYHTEGGAAVFGSRVSLATRSVEGPGPCPWQHEVLRDPGCPWATRSVEGCKGVPCWGGGAKPRRSCAADPRLDFGLGPVFSKCWAREGSRLRSQPRWGADLHRCGWWRVL